MAALLLPFTTAQRERLFNNRPANVGKGLALADWHRLVQFIEAAQQPCPSPVHAWAVVAPCGDGVLFSSLLDARWTLTGEGAGADGVGHPTIGHAFRECYAPALTLHRVQMTAQKGGAA